MEVQKGSRNRDKRGVTKALEAAGKALQGVWRRLMAPRQAPELVHKEEDAPPVSYNTEVVLQAVTPYGERLIEIAGRLCWDTQDKMGTVPDRIQKWIEVGHESMVEHASATFFIRASRVLTHELVRHRLASYSQRSQRYVKEEEPRYITPAEFRADIPPADRKVMGLTTFQQAMNGAWVAYGDLLHQGWPPELARYVLPGACETQIIMTMNFRELRHFIKLRTSPKCLPEMREVAGKVKEICQHIAPEVFGDL